METFGLHLTLDASGCKNKEALTSQSKIYDLLESLPSEIKMHRMTLPYVCKWIDPFSTSDVPGISGIVMLAESHISIHTFPDYNYVFIDIFSCRGFEKDLIINKFKDFFKSDNMEINMFVRGKNFPDKQYNENEVKNNGKD